MEGLQLAQIIADLQALQNADPTAAQALLSASKSPPPRRKSSATSTTTTTGTSTPRFDKLGRRILTGSPTPSRPPTSSRSQSTLSTSSLEPQTQAQGLSTDEDIQRAKTLVELVEMRGKFKVMGDTGLARAKQRVDEVVNRYEAKFEVEKEAAARKRRMQDRPVLR